MSDYIGIALGVMFGVIVSLVGLIIVMNAKHNQILEQISIKSFEKEMSWNTERQQLLDRIQAPSFDHLKQAEVRVIRAQKEEKKEQPIELV